MPQLIQGSWKELAKRAAEFGEREDLMLIIPGDQDAKNRTVPEGMSLAEALQGRTGLVSFEPCDLSEDTGKKFADLLVAKHQKEQR